MRFPVRSVIQFRSVAFQKCARRGRRDCSEESQAGGDGFFPDRVSCFHIPEHIFVSADKENQQEQNKDQQNQNKDKQDQQKDQQQGQDKQDQNQQQQQGGEPQEGKISKEDAERLLEALENDEKETQEKVQKQKAEVQQAKKMKIETNW